MSIEEIIAELNAWIDAHPDAPALDVLRVRRSIKVLQGIDE